jgi:hypothetical protein
VLCSPPLPAICHLFAACRKLPTDLTEATLSGAAISIATTFIILFLLGAVRFQLAASQPSKSPRLLDSFPSPSPIPPLHSYVHSTSPRLSLHYFLPQELSSYMSTTTRTDMVVDRSAHGELLRDNFNLSFPQLSCEYATLDVSDAMGLVSHRQRQAQGLACSGAGMSKARYAVRQAVWADCCHDYQAGSALLRLFSRTLA